MIDLDELDRLERAATPGPWRWRANLSAKDVYIVALRPMLPFVMQFRRWGMQSALPWFRDDKRGAMVPPKWIPVHADGHNAWDIAGIDHPDAKLLIEARNALPALLGQARAGERLAAALAHLDGESSPFAECPTCHFIWGHKSDCELAAALAAWRAAKEGR